MACCCDFYHGFQAVGGTLATIFGQMVAAVFLVILLADEKFQVRGAALSFPTGGAVVQAIGARGHGSTELLASLEDLPATGLQGVGRADGSTGEESDQMSGVGDRADHIGITDDEPNEH